MRSEKTSWRKEGKCKITVKQGSGTKKRERTKRRKKKSQKEGKKKRRERRRRLPLLCKLLLCPRVSFFCTLERFEFSFSLRAGLLSDPRACSLSTRTAVKKGDPSEGGRRLKKEKRKKEKKEKNSDRPTCLFRKTSCFASPASGRDSFFFFFLFPPHSPRGETRSFPYLSSPRP